MCITVYQRLHVLVIAGAVIYHLPVAVVISRRERHCDGFSEVIDNRRFSHYNIFKICFAGKSIGPQTYIAGRIGIVFLVNIACLIVEIYLYRAAVKCDLEVMPYTAVVLEEVGEALGSAYLFIQGVLIDSIEV